MQSKKKGSISKRRTLILPSDTPRLHARAHFSKLGRHLARAFAWEIKRNFTEIRRLHVSSSASMCTCVLLFMFISLRCTDYRAIEKHDKPNWGNINLNSGTVGPALVLLRGVESCCLMCHRNLGRYLFILC